MFFQNFSVVKVLELNKFVLVPTNALKSSDIEDVHLVACEGKCCRCIVVDNGGEHAMRHLLVILEHFTKVSNKYKSLGMVSTKTQTETHQEGTLGETQKGQTADDSATANITTHDEVQCGDFIVLESGELSPTATEPPPAHVGKSQPGDSKKKKHFCTFCKSMKTNISRHFTLQHKTEDKVQEFLKLPLKSLERKRIEAELRRTGDAEFNQKLHSEGKVPVPLRRGLDVGKTIPCPNCTLLYSRASLNRHYKICAGAAASKHIMRIQRICYDKNL